MLPVLKDKYKFQTKNDKKPKREYRDCVIGNTLKKLQIRKEKKYTREQQAQNQDTVANRDVKNIRKEIGYRYGLPLNASC